MNIEILDFYPQDRNDEKGIFNGTMRVGLPDFGIHLLGVFIAKRNKKWFIDLPSKKGFDSRTNMECQYPCISFQDREKQKELIDTIRLKADEFIEKRLKDLENPLVFPNRPKKSYVKPEVKKEIKPIKKEPIEAIKAKTWATPPPPKSGFHNTRSTVNKKA